MVLLVSIRSSLSENNPAIDEKGTEKNISSYNGSGLSHLLDRSSTVSVQTKLGEITNLRNHTFILHWDKKM